MEKSNYFGAGDGDVLLNNLRFIYLQGWSKIADFLADHEIRGCRSTARAAFSFELLLAKVVQWSIL